MVANSSAAGAMRDVWNAPETLTASARPPRSFASRDASSTAAIGPPTTICEGEL